MKKTILVAVLLFACFVLGAALFWPRGEAPPKIAATARAETAPAPVVTTPVPATLPTSAATHATGEVVEVSTEALKSGELKFADVNTPSLLHLLDDLRERLANDYAQHEGKPGPDAAYLQEWIDKVTAELRQRGIQSDAAGKPLPTPMPAK